MGVLYEVGGISGRGNRIAVYEGGQITDVSNYYNQKVIAKYYGNKVEESFINSSKTIGHVLGSNGYLGSPYLTSTGTPFIYADSCNRIYLYSTREHVADFEGDTTGALLAYMAYCCNGKATHTSQTNDSSTITANNSYSASFESSGDLVGGAECKRMLRRCCWHIFDLCCNTYFTMGLERLHIIFFMQR